MSYRELPPIATARTDRSSGGLQRHTHFSASSTTSHAPTGVGTTFSAANAALAQRHALAQQALQSAHHTGRSTSPSASTLKLQQQQYQQQPRLTSLSVPEKKSERKRLLLSSASTPSMSNTGSQPAQPPPVLFSARDDDHVIPDARAMSRRRRVQSGGHSSGRARGHQPTPIQQRSSLGPHGSALHTGIEQRRKQTAEKARPRDMAARTKIVHAMNTSAANASELLETVLSDKSPLSFSQSDHDATDAEDMLSLIADEGKLLDKCIDELSRQVASESATHAFYLSRLRQRYATLISQVPRTVVLLHEENALVMAINAQLQAKMADFKEEVLSVRALVVESEQRLSQLKQPPKNEQLDRPTDYTQSPADMKHELHDLYELQRSRLIKEMEKVRSERDTWCQAAFQLAAAVAEKRHFTIMRRLQLHQTTWNTSSQRYCARLTLDCNGINANIKTLLTQWKKQLFMLHRKLEEDDLHLKKTMQAILDELETLERCLQKHEQTNGTIATVYPKFVETLASWQRTLSDVLDDTISTRVDDFQLREKESEGVLQEAIASANTLFKCFERLEAKNLVKLRALNEEKQSFFENVGDRVSIASDFVGSMMTLRDGAEEVHRDIEMGSNPSLERLKSKVATWRVVLEMMIDFVTKGFNVRPLVSHADEWLLALTLDTATQCAQLADQVGDTTRKTTAWFVNAQKIACGINEVSVHSLGEEGKEAMAQLVKTTQAVITACKPMAALTPGEYKETSSIDYEREQWATLCEGIIRDFKGAADAGLDLTTIFAQNKEVTDVTEEWDANEGFGMASVDAAGNIVIETVKTYDELKKDRPEPSPPPK